MDHALRSLAAEADDGIEILVIDSSPTTTTIDIARGYSNRLRIRIIKRPDLSSWQTKTNVGVLAAESRHVCWLGADDVWIRGRAAAVKAWIAEAPKVPLHFASSIIIDNQGRKLGVWKCPLPENIALSSRLVIERLLVQNFVAAAAPVFRREAWLACGGLDETLWYTADWDMWLKLAAFGPIYYHGLTTVGFRIHGNSLTMSAPRDAADFERQMRMVVDRHLSKPPGTSKDLERVALTSIAVNVALASAFAGRPTGLMRAVIKVLDLRPAGICRYFRDSRILDRVLPRLRAVLAGKL